MALVRACVAMLPVLMAEESMLDAERQGVGTGAYAQHDRCEIVARWRAQASRSVRATPRATTDDLAAIGIGYRVVEKRA